MRNTKKRLLIFVILIISLSVIVCWAARDRISDFYFESAEGRNEDVFKEGGESKGAFCDKFADRMILKYRVALFFNKRNYAAVGELLAVMDSCRGKKAVLKETERMLRDEPDDVNYLLVIHLYQGMNGEYEASLKSLERINAINGFFLADKNFCGSLALLYLKAGETDKAIASLEKCCNLAKAGHGDVNVACKRNFDALRDSIFPFNGSHELK